MLNSTLSYEKKNKRNSFAVIVEFFKRERILNHLSRYGKIIQVFYLANKRENEFALL